jgi:hypothetical protein
MTYATIEQRRAAEKARYYREHEKIKAQRIKGNKVHRIKRKAMAVAYLGGKCIKCGYSKCFDAFDFHHRDPSQKEFGLTKDKLQQPWEVVVKELDKCDLLCATCHREVHFELNANA